MTGKDRARLAIYGMAGAYLLVLVYQMYESFGTAVGTTRTLTIVFMVLFAIIGIAMIALSGLGLYKNTKHDHAAAQQQTPETQEAPETQKTLEAQEALDAPENKDTTK